MPNVMLVRDTLGGYRCEGTVPGGSVGWAVRVNRALTFTADGARWHLTGALSAGQDDHVDA